MSKRTDEFEENLATFIRNMNVLPMNIPQWMIDLHIVPGSQIISAERIGSKNSKTDILVKFEEGAPLKISAKLSNADYFGNWYSHTRIVEEFGLEVFEKLVIDCTEWANKWKHGNNSSLFIGVSICFGKRLGDTGREFTEIFNAKDIIKIVAGVGEGDYVANCLYKDAEIPTTIEQLFHKLTPINDETVIELAESFKVAYRPINPKTEYSNRGKCSYTQFVPYEKLPAKTTVDELPQLNALGQYETVTYNSINHNRILKELEAEYNIVIPSKQK